MSPGGLARRLLGDARGGEGVELDGFVAGLGLRDGESGGELVDRALRAGDAVGSGSRIHDEARAVGGLDDQCAPRRSNLRGPGERAAPQDPARRRSHADLVAGLIHVDEVLAEAEHCRSLIAVGGPGQVPGAAVGEVEAVLRAADAQSDRAADLTLVVDAAVAETGVDRGVPLRAPDRESISMKLRLMPAV